ncbi:Stk1 family PASTA domain-containing Ser/Thr kinase [Millisia brevis]|uniref:Stk1 family PASTA domain-containing Ser/Thr kinase n=1 Tax=Millisia brevis TaxID=264148 RepID=UPI0009FE3136
MTASRGLVGTLVDGRYRIDELIARGGMSTVFRALDVRLNRPVAIKVMDPAFAADPQFLARFEFEALAVARLHHPGLVAVYDHGRDHDLAFIVMELVEGGTLRELLRERGPMPPHAVVAVMQPVLDALAVAHRAGLVHRDIKPENVLISYDGAVKVADFGLVRAVAAANVTSNSVILGTAAYLSPEQVSSGRADARSDVYSAGILTYELLTGETPFEGDSSLAIAFARIDREVPPPSSAAQQDVPELFDDFVLQATAPNPEDRFPDAGAMSAALGSITQQLELPTYRVPAPMRIAQRFADFDDGTIPPPVHRVRPRAGAEPPAEEDRQSEQRSTQLRRGDNRKVPRPREPDFLENRRRGRQAIAIWLAVVFMLAAGLAVGGWYLGVGTFQAVPRVSNMDPGTAASTLQSAGYDSRQREQYDNTVPAGWVIGTDPREGTRTTRSTIEILVSKGRPTVPQIQGTPSTDTVRDLLTERGLNAVDGERRVSPGVPDGVVVALDPPPGTTVDVGSEVRLVLSGAPETTQSASAPATRAEPNTQQEPATQNAAPEPVTTEAPVPVETQAQGQQPTVEAAAIAVAVPSLRGLNTDDARFALELEQLTSAGERIVPAADVTPGRVTGSEPSAGTMVAPGTAVTILVAG